MSVTKYPSGLTLQVRLPPALADGLDLHAHQARITKEDAAEAILRAALIAAGVIPEAIRDQAIAEGDILRRVDEKLEDLRGTSWGEDVINDVFAYLRDHHRTTYDRAVSGGQRARINRRLGSRVRRGLGAGVRIVDERRDMGQTPAGMDSLVKTWTKLIHESDGTGAVTVSDVQQ